MPGTTPPLSSRTPSPDPSYDPTNSNLQPNNRAPTFRRQPTGQGNQNAASGVGSQNVQQPPVFTHGSTSVPQHLFGPIWAGPQPQPQVMQQPTGIFNKRSQAALDNSPGSQILTTDVTGQSVKRSRQTQPQGHQPAPQSQLNAAQPTHRTRQEMINLANAIQTRGPMRDDSLPLPGFNQGASSGKNSHAVREAKRDDFTALVLENPRLNAEDLVKKMQGRYPGTLRKTVNELSMQLKQAWAFGLPTSVVDNMRRVASNPAYDRFIEDSLTKDTGQRGRILNTGPFASWQQLENRWENRPAPRTRPEIMEYLRPLARTPENAAIFASMALPDDYVCDLPEALDLWRQYDAGTLNPQSLGPRATPLLHPDVAAAQAATRQQAPGDNYLDNVSLISSASSSPQGTLPPAVNYGVQNLPGLNANSQGDSILAHVAQAQQQRRSTDPRGDGPNNLTQTRLHQPSATSISTISSGPVQMERRTAGNPGYLRPLIPNYPQQPATNTAANPGGMGNPNSYVQDQGQFGSAQQMHAQRRAPQQTQVMSNQPSGQTYVQQMQQPVQQHFQPSDPYANSGANPNGDFNSMQLQGMNQPPVVQQNPQQSVQQQGQGGNYLPPNPAGVQMQQRFQQNFQSVNQTPDPYTNSRANLIGDFNSMQLQGVNQPPVYQQYPQQSFQQQGQGGNYLPPNLAGVQMQQRSQQNFQSVNQAPDPYTNSGANLIGDFNSMQLQGVNQPPVYQQYPLQSVQQQGQGGNYLPPNPTGVQMPPGPQLFGQPNPPPSLSSPPSGDAQSLMSPVNLDLLNGSPLPTSRDMDVYFPSGPGGPN